MMRFVFSNFGLVSLVANHEDVDFDVARHALDIIEEESEMGRPYGEPDNGIYLFESEDDNPEHAMIDNCRRLTPMEAAQLAAGVLPWDIAEHGHA